MEDLEIKLRRVERATQFLRKQNVEVWRAINDLRERPSEPIQEIEAFKRHSNL
jgi:hypothetical protein